MSSSLSSQNNILAENELLTFAEMDKYVSETDAICIKSINDIVTDGVYSYYDHIIAIRHSTLYTITTNDESIEHACNHVIFSLSLLPYRRIIVINPHSIPDRYIISNPENVPKLPDLNSMGIHSTNSGNVNSDDQKQIIADCLMNNGRIIIQGVEVNSDNSNTDSKTLSSWSSSVNPNKIASVIRYSMTFDDLDNLKSKLLLMFYQR